MNQNFNECNENKATSYQVIELRPSFCKNLKCQKCQNLRKELIEHTRSHFCCKQTSIENDKDMKEIRKCSCTSLIEQQNLIDQEGKSTKFLVNKKFLNCMDKFDEKKNAQRKMSGGRRRSSQLSTGSLKRVSSKINKKKNINTSRLSSSDEQRNKKLSENNDNNYNPTLNAIDENQTNTQETTKIDSNNKNQSDNKGDKEQNENKITEENEEGVGQFVQNPIDNSNPDNPEINPLISTEDNENLIEGENININEENDPNNQDDNKSISSKTPDDNKSNENVNDDPNYNPATSSSSNLIPTNSHVEEEVSGTEKPEMAQSIVKNGDGKQIITFYINNNNLSEIILNIECPDEIFSQININANVKYLDKTEPTPLIGISHRKN